MKNTNVFLENYVVPTIWTIYVSVNRAKTPK
jgi:hypothetical protein